MTVGCACGSIEPYERCCAPLHRGEREAATPVELMRSRYSAFALGKPRYLWRTLHADHGDRAREEREWCTEVERSIRRVRYRGLEILDARDADRQGVARVLFMATIRSKGGQDLSFVELSSFVHDGIGWRYLLGTAIPISAIVRDPRTLRIGDAELGT